MRIYKRITKGAALVALSLGLTACVDLQQTESVGPTPIPKVVRVTVAGGEVVIAAPNGFCVDRATIDQNARGTFMLLSDCHVVAKTGEAARMPISTILTASISPTGLVGRENGMKSALAGLGAFFTTPVGLLSLGKSQVEGAVSILETKQTSVALYLLVQDTAYRDGTGVSLRYWRAFTEVNGRLVALSVTGYSDEDPEERRSLRIIRAFVQSIIDANGAT